jgi:hypothetical protein
MKKKTIELVFHVDIDPETCGIANQIIKDDKVLINYIGSAPVMFLSHNENNVRDCSVNVFNPTSEPARNDEDLIPTQISAIKVTWELQQNNNKAPYGISYHIDGESLNQFKRVTMPQATDDCVQPVQKIPIREEMVDISDERFIKELMHKRTIFYQAKNK